MFTLSKYTLVASIGLLSVLPAFAADKATKTSAPAAPSTKSASLTVDPSKSKVSWAGTKKMGSGHTGEVSVQSGTVSMNDKTLTGGEIVIDMKSINVTDIPATDANNAKLKGHLSNADFFDVEKFPTSKLVVTSAKALGGGKHEVKGKMTIKDVTQDVTFPVEVKKQGAETVATGKLTLDRTAYGVKYGSANFFKLAADKVINNDMVLDFNVVAK